MSETTKSRATWSGKLAFVLSAAASAVGFGQHVALSLFGGEIRRRHVFAHVLRFRVHHWLGVAAA